MTYIELAEACGVYECAERPKINRHRIAHNALATFAITLDRFMANHKEELEDDFWNPIVRLLKRRRYLMQAVPLSFEAIAASDSETFEKGKASLRRVQFVFPQLADEAQNLFNMCHRLSGLNDNPLGDLIQSNFLESEKSSNYSAILIRDSRWSHDIENSFGSDKRFRKLHVISPECLRAGTCYENIYCVGPAKWFPDHVFSSARSLSIHLYCYNWIKDRQSIPNPFRAGSVEVTTPKSSWTKRDSVISLVDSGRADERLIEAEDVIPTIDIPGIKKRIRETADTEDFAQEVQARLFVLEGNALVMLQTEGNSSHLVIDPLYWHDDDEGAEATVNKVLTSEIEPGMFVLIRSGGGGDYIEPIADEILGERAQDLRALQQHWKNLLKQRVKEVGIEEAISELKGLGSEKANNVNLGNWMSARSIKTRDYEDFEALMEFIGISEQCESFWIAAETIHSAHRSAGFSIRRALIDKISQTSIKDLQKTGSAEFSVGDSNEGSMLVLRVKTVVQDLFTVPESSLGKLLEGSEDLWR